MYYFLLSDLTLNKKAEFLDLVRKLHRDYKGHLDAALIATGQFEKATRYFIRALRKIKPSELDTTTDSFSSLREIENLISLWTASETESTNEEENGDVDLRSLLKSFLTNIQNFRILRQLVKMEIIQTLKQLPEELEDELQTRSRGEMEILLSAWTGLLNRDSDLTKLQHPKVDSYQQYFLSEEEMGCMYGVLSVIPKLIDIVNKIDFLLVKYLMDSSTV